MTRFSIASPCAVILFAITSSIVPAASAQGADIHTGGSTGAYYSTFCPRLESKLNRAGYDYRCKTSAGTRENIEQVYLSPRNIGYGQLDVIALETADIERSPFTILRSDDVKECVFAVTRSRDIESYGDITGFASQIKFILPPAASGSAGTFQFLQEIDRDGLGLARNITFANSTDDAIIRALNTQDAVAFFVQFPDPKNERFKLIKRMGGQLVPVLDRNILKQKVGGEKIYFAQETDVDNASWSKIGSKVVTSCTPLVVFTGAPFRISNDADQRAHQRMIDTVKAIRTSLLLPSKGFFAKLLSRTRSLTAKTRERLLSISEKARKKARPIMERAKQRALDLGATAAEKAARMREKALPRQ